MKKKIKTQIQVAAEIGISRRSLSEWKRGGMDTSPGNMEALRDRAGQVETRITDSSAISRARLRKLEAEADRIEHALEVERGRWILRDDAYACGLIAGQRSREEWERIEDSLPPLLDGLSALAMKTKLREYARETIGNLAILFTNLKPD